MFLKTTVEVRLRKQKIDEFYKRRKVTQKTSIALSISSLSNQNQFHLFLDVLEQVLYMGTCRLKLTT